MTPEPPVTPRQARDLLRVAAPATPRPVDRLIDRLKRTDGAEWFGGVMERFTRRVAGRSAEALLEGRLSPETLTRGKEQAKTLLAEATSLEDEIAATACYFMTCAAARAHHGIRIHRDESGAVEAALVDLADALPAGWAEMARAGAEGTSADAAGR